MVAGALTAGLAAGCEDTNQSFIVLGVAVGTPQQQGGCTYQVDSDFVVRPSGILDLALRNNYRAPLAVENQLIVRRDELNARAESNYGVFSSADVRTLDSAGATVSNFTTPVTPNPVPAGVQRSVVFADVMDPNLVNQLGRELKRGQVKEYVTYVKLRGRTSGNKEVVTDEFQYLMQVCNGCLIGFPANSRDPSFPKNNCLSSEKPDREAPCAIGNDDAVDCRYCRGVSSCDPCVYNPADAACQ